VISWIYIRRGGREFKSPSRYEGFSNGKSFLFSVNAWIYNHHGGQVRRGGREFKSSVTLPRLLEIEVFFLT
jgi:hypothetical protein